VADIVSDEKGEVWGVVYEIPSKEDVSRLDRCEGFDAERGPDENAYNRRTVKVGTEDGRILRADTYFATATGEFQPSRTYLCQIIRAAEFWQLPLEYVGRLRRIATKD